MTNPKEPIVIPEDRTEHEEARRLARDWLRERDDSNAIDFENLEADQRELDPIAKRVLYGNLKQLYRR